MRLPKQDVIATGLVAGAGLLYGLWAAEAAPPGLDSVRSTGLVILVLGFAASRVRSSLASSSSCMATSSTWV